MRLTLPVLPRCYLYYLELGYLVSLRIIVNGKIIIWQEQDICSWLVAVQLSC